VSVCKCDCLDRSRCLSVRYLSVVVSFYVLKVSTCIMTVSLCVPPASFVSCAAFGVINDDNLF